MGGYGTFVYGGGSYGGGLASGGGAATQGTMVDPIDSYYNYIEQQMNKLPSPSLLGGYANAKDWPQAEVEDGKLYLLFLNAVPVQNTGYPKSETQILYRYICQWTWLLIGADIARNQQALNRGNRFRQHTQIMTNLRQANFPGFCQKFVYAADAEGNVTAAPVQTTYPLTLVESIWWSKPKFTNQVDNKKSGLVYGVAAVDLYSYDDVNVVLVA